MPEDQPVEETTNADLRKTVCEMYGLPLNSNASDVVQFAIDQSGHECKLIDILKLAAIFDGTLELRVTDNESVEPKYVAPAL